MFTIDAGSQSQKYCDGQSRRSFLKLGVAGMGAIGLPQILRAKEAAAAAGKPRKDTSVILLWLDGGPGHMDTYDMKPEAPPEYRGLWRPIKTNVPGMEVTELFPLHAVAWDAHGPRRGRQRDEQQRQVSVLWLDLDESHWPARSRHAGQRRGAVRDEHRDSPGLLRRHLPRPAREPVRDRRGPEQR